MSMSPWRACSPQICSPQMEPIQWTSTSMRPSEYSLIFGTRTSAIPFPSDVVSFATVPSLSVISGAAAAPLEIVTSAAVQSTAIPCFRCCMSCYPPSDDARRYRVPLDVRCCRPPDGDSRPAGWHPSMGTHSVRHRESAATDGGEPSTVRFDMPDRYARRGPNPESRIRSEKSRSRIPESADARLHCTEARGRSGILRASHHFRSLGNDRYNDRQYASGRRSPSFPRILRPTRPRAGVHRVTVTTGTSRRMATFFDCRDRRSAPLTVRATTARDHDRAS